MPFKQRKKNAKKSTKGWKSGQSVNKFKKPETKTNSGLEIETETKNEEIEITGGQDNDIDIDIDVNANADANGNNNNNNNKKIKQQKKNGNNRQKNINALQKMKASIDLFTQKSIEKYGGKTTRAKIFPIHRNCSEIEIYQLLENICKPISISLDKPKMKIIYENGEDGKKASVGKLVFSSNEDCSKAVEYVSGRKLAGLTLTAQYEPQVKYQSFFETATRVYISNINPNVTEQDLYKFLHSKVKNLTNFSYQNEKILLKHHLTDKTKSSVGFIQLNSNKEAVSCVNALCGVKIKNTRIYARLSKSPFNFEPSEHLKGKTKEICIDNVHWSVTTDELKQFCQKFISNITNTWIVNCTIWFDERGYSKSKASIEFDNNEHASLAFNALNGKKLKGFTVKVGFKNAKAMQKPKSPSKQKAQKKNFVTKSAKLKKSGVNTKAQKANGSKKNVKVTNIIKGHKHKQSKISKVLKSQNKKGGKQQNGANGAKKPNQRQNKNQNNKNQNKNQNQNKNRKRKRTRKGPKVAAQ